MGEPDQIAQLEARRAAAEAKVKAAREARAATDALRKAEDATALAEAVAEHGELDDGVAAVGTPSGIVVVRRPSESRWRRAHGELDVKSAARVDEAAKALILDHLVHPSRDAYFALCATYPGLDGRVMRAIGSLAAGGAGAGAGER